MTNSTRGYDDTQELMEMAVGIFDGRFKSVEHAARSVLTDATQSNVDRLRRKFRQQSWMDKGREEFIRRAATPSEMMDDENCRPAAFSDYMRVFTARIRHPRATLRAIFSNAAFWDAPYVPATFIAFLLAYPPVIMSCVQTFLGRQPDPSLWTIPAFVVTSLMPLAACLVTLEDFEGYPNLFPEDHSASSGTTHGAFPA